MGKIELIRDGFGSAAENMAFDEALLDSRALFDRVIRAYIWQRPGVTYSYNKPAPDPIAELDRSSRPTGGGLVFHSPGDIVFSIVVPVDDLVIDGPLKEKMVRLSMASRLALGQVGISVDGKVVAKRAPNITFCNAYPNPFELYVGGEKVVAMTLRRIKTRVLVQGIVHLQDNHNFFAHLDKLYHPYFTKGLSGKVSPELFQASFLSQFGDKQQAQISEILAG